MYLAPRYNGRQATCPGLPEKTRCSLLAMEHLRWMDAMQTEGYPHRPVRDDGARKHPALVPCADLPGPGKEKDRDAARMIPRYLALIGMRVFRRKKGAE